jgi:hypothetical protein
VSSWAATSASTAILLKRGKPDLRIWSWTRPKVRLESRRVDRRGLAYFDTRLEQYRLRISSQAGFRLVPQRRRDLPPGGLETSPRSSRAPSFQLDRSKLGEHLLKVAGEEGEVGDW